jgi:hypothetical protein
VKAKKIELQNSENRKKEPIEEAPL